MLKLIITLMTLVHILIAQNANEIYTNDLRSRVINYQGTNYICFDLPNAEILQARDIMLWKYEKEYNKKDTSKIYKYIAVTGVAYIVLDITLSALIPK